MAQTIGDMKPEDQKRFFIFLGGIIIVGILLIFAVSGGSSDPATTAPTETVEEVQEEEVVEEEQGEYDLEVRSTLEGLQITNREAELLVECDIEVNSGLLGGGYKSQINVPANDSSLIVWGNLTKDGERFNFYETAPERVSVSNCNNDKRFSYYEF